MLSACCPGCGFSGEIEAFLTEVEAKRAVTRVAAIAPDIGRVIGPYLRLFGSGKRGVTMRRAVNLIDDLVALIETGTVCADDRVGVHRPAAVSMWAAGIELMIANPPSGQLENHRYLRKVVFGLADQADAKAERTREESAKTGRRAPAPAAPANDSVANAIAFAKSMLEYGQFDQAKHDQHIADAKARAGRT